MSFADQVVATGGLAIAWTQLRFTLKTGPNAGQNQNANLDLIGCRNLSGAGFTREGVALVFGSGGDSQALRITPGRVAPNEATLGLDPATWRQVWLPNVTRRVGGKPSLKPALFTLQMQVVDELGAATFSVMWIDAIDTGLDLDTPETGDPVESKVKIKPTRIRIT